MPKINRKNLSQIFDDDNSIYKDFYTKNHIIRLDNARKDIDEKQKRLNWNNRNKDVPTLTKNMRSTSMELINSDAYLKGASDNSSAINNLRKNLRESLSSMNIMKEDDNDDDFDYYCQ
jgi:hypothetical protein